MLPSTAEQTKNRDFLANERTFLAYIRTALAFIAFGFVIARFSLFAREISAVAHTPVPETHLSAGFGTAMAVAGIALGVYGAARYASTNAAIVANEARPMPVGVAIASAAGVAVVGLIVAFILLQVH